MRNAKVQKALPKPVRQSTESREIQTSVEREEKKVYSETAVGTEVAVICIDDVEEVVKNVVEKRLHKQRKCREKEGMERVCEGGARREKEGGERVCGKEGGGRQREGDESVCKERGYREIEKETMELRKPIPIGAESLKKIDHGKLEISKSQKLFPESQEKLNIPGFNVVPRLQTLKTLEQLIEERRAIIAHLEQKRIQEKIQKMRVITEDGEGRENQTVREIKGRETQTVRESERREENVDRNRLREKTEKLKELHRLGHHVHFQSTSEKLYAVQKPIDGSKLVRGTPQAKVSSVEVISAVVQTDRLKKGVKEKEKEESTKVVKNKKKKYRRQKTVHDRRRSAEKLEEPSSRSESERESTSRTEESRSRTSKGTSTSRSREGTSSESISRTSESDTTESQKSSTASSRSTSSSQSEATSSTPESTQRSIESSQPSQQTPKEEKEQVILSPTSQYLKDLREKVMRERIAKVLK